MVNWARVMSPALAMLLASAGVLGLFLSGGPTWPDETEEGGSTDMASTTTETIPPLDAAAPKETETATFALG